MGWWSYALSSVVTDRYHSTSPKIRTPPNAQLTQSNWSTISVFLTLYTHFLTLYTHFLTLHTHFLTLYTHFLTLYTHVLTL